ncbi:hypothetical protein [Cellulosimicrobium sp. Marseille-Q8652]
MNDQKDTPGGTRPLHEELFDDGATQPVTGPTGDETLVLPAASASSPPPAHAGQDDPSSTRTPSSGTPTAGTPGGPMPGTPGAAPGGPAATALDPVTEREPHRGPRVATIVWGFVLFAIGAAVLAAALGADVDLGLAAIVVLVVAGVTLVVGSVVTGVRRRGQV